MSFVSCFRVLSLAGWWRRYVMLLHELRKATHAAHPDYGLLEVAVEEIEKVANHVNEQKRDAENRARVNDVRLR